MKIFDDDFPVELFQTLLLQFNEVERHRIAECPNIVRQPLYSRRVRRLFFFNHPAVDSERGVVSDVPSFVFKKLRILRKRGL